MQAETSNEAGMRFMKTHSDHLPSFACGKPHFRRWILKPLFVVGGWLLVGFTGLCLGQDAENPVEESGLKTDLGAQVAVVYNTNNPDSKAVAEHYAAARSIPDRQVIGLDMPAEEEITRKDFDKRIQEPLLEKLEKLDLFRFDEPKKRGLFSKGNGKRKLVESKIRYLVLCYGTPLRIGAVSGLKEPGMEKIPGLLQRNEASVSQELAIMAARQYEDPGLTGYIINPFYKTEDPSQINPLNGVLMVTRLDGPTPEIAKGLVDKAILAEEWGLWGRAYFDTRGISNGAYKMGDDMLKAAYNIVRLLGFPVDNEDTNAVFPYEYPMSEIAFYAGWYTTHPEGAMARPDVEFSPGAIAYHLHSFSAATLRSKTQNWAGPLLAKGATATLGCVYEPYLEFTPDIEVLFAYLMKSQSTLGEAAYSALPTLSWQSTVVGDPLYRPFGKNPQDQHGFLFNKQSALIEWSFLRGLNLNFENKKWNIDQAVQFLEGIPFTQQSGVLLEALADLKFRKAEFKEAAEIARKATLAVTNQNSKWRRIRLALKLADYLKLAGDAEGALKVYEQFRTTFPGYTSMRDIILKQADLALQLGELELAKTYKSQAQ